MKRNFTTAIRVFRFCCDFLDLSDIYRYFVILSSLIFILILLGSLDFLESSFAIFRISMHSKLRRKWEKSSNCSTRETFVGCRLKRDSAEMIVAKIFAINKAAGKRDAHARRRTCSYNTIVRF